jgi:hypothetical protein
MSGLQQAIQFRSQIRIYLESMKFFSVTRTGTVVANLLVRKAMVAGHILEADEQCRCSRRATEIIETTLRGL